MKETAVALARLLFASGAAAAPGTARLQHQHPTVRHLPAPAIRLVGIGRNGRRPAVGAEGFGHLHRRASSLPTMGRAAFRAVVATTYQRRDPPTWPAALATSRMARSRRRPR